MTVYAWPNWPVKAFELRVLPNTRAFNGAYTPVTQTMDFLGERWVARLDLATSVNPIVIAAWEAFWDRLKGQANQISMGHLKLSYPQGTLRGSPTTLAAAAQLANTVTLTGCAVGSTLLPGDMLGIGGQLIRIMAPTVADGSGHMPIEFQPRVRPTAGWAAGLAVTWLNPTANFMLKSGDVATTWEPGLAEGTSVELIEVP